MEKNHGEEDALAQKEAAKAFMCSGVRECLSWSEDESVCACLCVNSCPSVCVNNIVGASFPNLTSCVTMSLDLGSSLGLQS